MISEAASKNKRGRPVVLPSWMFAVSPSMQSHTRRAKQNAAYACHGMQVLGIGPNKKPEHAFAWLANWKLENARQRGIKFGILAELGRIAEALGDDVCIEMARMICYKKPTVKAGVQILRAARLSLVRQA